jgi:polyferredoxin
MTLQRKRFLFQAGFFLLFVCAPVLDIFRLDLNLKHFIFFGHAWTLGLDPLLAGEIGPGQAALNIVLRGFVPLALLVGAFVWVSWKYGRLYCGWMCPHFSVVETINRFLQRTIGKHSLWDRERLPERRPDGHVIHPDPVYWWLVVPAVAGFAFLWGLTLLTYLLPPAEIYSNLAHLALTRNQALFLFISTGVFFIDFMFARHLFCRFGCAVGLAQSLVWMANKKAMVVGYDRTRAVACARCNAACDNACPMRLKPRTIKRHMFSCTQCGQCVSACNDVQKDNPQGALLKWVDEACALDVSDRDFGRRPVVPVDCFRDTVSALKSRFRSGLAQFARHLPGEIKTADADSSHGLRKKA